MQNAAGAIANGLEDLIENNVCSRINKLEKAVKSVMGSVFQHVDRASNNRLGEVLGALGSAFNNGYQFVDRATNNTLSNLPNMFDQFVNRALYGGDGTTTFTDNLQAAPTHVNINEIEDTHPPAARAA